MYLLYLRSEKQPLIIEIEKLRYFHDNISKWIIKYLLVCADEAINNFLMFKAKLDKYLKSLVISGFFIFNLKFEMFLYSFHYVIFIWLNNYLMLLILRYFLHYYFIVLGWICLLIALILLSTRCCILSSTIIWIINGCISIRGIVNRIIIVWLVGIIRNIWFCENEFEIILKQDK